MQLHIPLPDLDTLATLTKKPGTVMIAHAGEDLFVSDSQGIVHLYRGLDWGALTDDEISQWLASHPLDR